jgi:hypothetical protein
MNWKYITNTSIDSIQIKPNMKNCSRRYTSKGLLLEFAQIAGEHCGLKKAAQPVILVDSVSVK